MWYQRIKDANISLHIKNGKVIQIELGWFPNLIYCHRIKSIWNCISCQLLSGKIVLLTNSKKNIYRVFFITTGLKQFKTTHFFPGQFFFVLTLKQTFLNYLWDFRFMCFTSVCHLLFSRRRYCDCPCSVSSDVWWFYCFRKYWK